MLAQNRPEPPMYRPTVTIQQARNDSIVLAVVLMAAAAVIWLVTRFLSR